MATVYLAVAMGTSGFRKLAVVKQLRHDLALDTDFVQMFLDEAKLCARLSHANIVQTYDVGMDEYGHLMAMEYLDGVSMHAAVARLRKNGDPLTFPQQARVLLEVLEGLRYAHELKDYDGTSLNIVHRDISPQNVFLTYDGMVKLLDFGIAKAAISSTHTATGVIKGKLSYMAPEQARGEPVDARADLYAVGVMLWEAVTGRRRWPADLTQPALFLQLARDEPPEPPNAASFGFPSEVDAVVMKALAPKPADRFQTAAEFLDALERILRKFDPVALRSIGARLGDAFSDARERMRSVIEEQFRIMEGGDPGSGPRAVPALKSPSSVTTSEALRPEKITEADAVTQTASISLRTQAAARKRTSELLRTGALVGSGLLFAATLGILVLHNRKPDAPIANATASALAAPDSHPAMPPASAVAERPQEPRGSELAPPRAEGSGATAAGETSPASSASSHTTTRPRPGPIARPGPTHAAAPEPVAPLPPPTAAPPPERPTAEPGLPRPQAKPRVQLERENPWP